MIIDLDKVPDLLWKSMWKEEASLYAAKIKEKSFDKVTAAIDKIQDDELEKNEK